VAAVMPTTDVSEFSSRRFAPQPDVTKIVRYQR